MNSTSLSAERIATQARLLTQGLPAWLPPKRASVPRLSGLTVWKRNTWQRLLNSLPSIAMAEVGCPAKQARRFIGKRRFDFHGHTAFTIPMTRIA